MQPTGAGAGGISPELLQVFDGSLGRCEAKPEFLDRFYDVFLASSPKVREKFDGTDFNRQKNALRASFHSLLLAAQDQRIGARQHLGNIAERHSSRGLKIGAELYDLWLDSLLSVVKEVDPEWTPEVEQAWERVMTVGIVYLLSQY